MHWGLLIVRALFLTVVCCLTLVAVMGVSSSAGVLETFPWIKATVVIAGDEYSYYGGTSAFSVTGGPDGSDQVRFYDDCKKADDAAICRSCDAVDVGTTVFVVFAFIFSLMSMGWGYYDICADTADDTYTCALLAIVKKLAGLIFSICALASYKDCYDGMGSDDDVIIVDSYEYGIGAISLICSIVLIASASAISFLKLYLHKNDGARVGAEMRNEVYIDELKKNIEGPNKDHHRHHHPVSHDEEALYNAIETDGLDCHHKSHSHGFKSNHGNGPRRNSRPTA